ncbi:hypothetical protein MHBO_004172 [Bonamia ostreae]|uniref:Adenylate cyclase-associated CAP C-terminal domain-containing protein n=1 Tax=Bonamia ostreae TaxID=126728 RepID=A0ABV2ASK1_9EUKA
MPTVIADKAKEMLEKSAKPDEEITVEKCNGTTVVFAGGFRKLCIKNSTGVTAAVDSLDALCIENNKDLKVLVKGASKSVCACNCSKVVLQVQEPEGMKVTHCACEEFNLLLPEGDDLKEHSMPSTITTCLTDKGLKHSVSETT